MTPLQIARDALLNCIKTIEAASPTMTEICKPVLGGRLWGSNTIAQAQAAIAALDATPAHGWRDIVSAPKDGTEFLSWGGPESVFGKVQPTRWLSPGPYTTENGKNAEGQRRYQWPDGFYWAGYDGFVGPVSPTLWRPMPSVPTDATPPETPDERQAAIVRALRADAHRCDCFAYSYDECTCGAWAYEPGERSFKRKSVEDVADWIESGEWRK